MIISFLSDTYSGNVGLAISQALILTGMVQFGIRQITETTQQMTSVERICQYTDLEPVYFIARILNSNLLNLFDNNFEFFSSTGTQSRRKTSIRLATNWKSKIPQYVVAIRSKR